MTKNRVTNAFNSIRGDWIHWPDAVERKEISRRIEEEFFLPNCVAIMDGTLLPLRLEPDCADKADYHQLLRLVEEHYIRPVYGSPVSIDMSAMMSINTDNMSDIGEEIIFSD